jgi:DNA-directed RNA polymerase specialized sigma24 family protein
MGDDSSVDLQALIDRIRQGDAGARRLLLERACGRLRRLAARLLHGSFPALAARHELDSVVHETWLRLAQALDRVEPPTVADFFRLAAHKIRQVLLDMAERQRRLGGREILVSSDTSTDERCGGPADNPAAEMAVTMGLPRGGDGRDDGRCRASATPPPRPWPRTSSATSTASRSAPAA